MRRIVVLALVALVALVYCAPQTPIAASSIIKNLPGLPKSANFDQYAGYINVDEVNGRALFYWFVESQSNPDTDPLIIWLTGGPGCSGLIALLGENGPFQPKLNVSNLELNPWSWNRIANVIYIESPAGVGFSYSNTTSDYNVGDVRTANDTFNFLQTFLTIYPQFAQNDFWITGESYGGHYVPNLAARILAGNEAGQPKINLKGFLVGNAWTFMPIDNLGAITFWYTHALMPQSTYTQILDSCDLTDYGPLKRDAQTAACDAAVQQSSNEMGDINIYDIYVPVCHSTYNEYVINQLAKAGSPAHKIMAPKRPPSYPIDPCIDLHLTEYLNLPAVQSAIHALPTTWAECSSVVNYNYSDVRSSVIPKYEEFFEYYPELRILVYSGDVDAIVPYPGSRNWTMSFNQTQIKPWTPWYVGQQVGGYLTVFESFYFTTVREAGHQVPFYQPQRAWHMFSNFITGNW